jgi:hypothetical protein
MTTAETNATDKAAAVAAQGPHVAPGKPASKKAASQKNAAPKAKKTARVPSREGGAKASKTSAGKKAAAPRAESKGAMILDMIARARARRSLRL